MDSDEMDYGLSAQELLDQGIVVDFRRVTGANSGTEQEEDMYVLDEEALFGG